MNPRQVEEAGWARLLPAHRVDGGDQPVGPPRCVQLVGLGESGSSLAILLDDRDRVYPAPLISVDGGRSLRRAAPGEGASKALLAALADSSLLGLEIICWHNETVVGERALGVDQTNESVIVGERAVVKWTFVADGPHPAPSLFEDLQRGGFVALPRPWAAVSWRPEPAEPARLVALVTEFAEGAIDGWTWVVNDLLLAARAHPTPAQDESTDAAQSAGAAVGELVGSFHRALDGTARPATPEEVHSWNEGALTDMEHALQLSTGPELAMLITHADRMRKVFERPAAREFATMRIHGDLHVGQVLRVPSSRQKGEPDPSAPPSYLLTDFDGNPVVAPSDRLALQPAMLDVAGMAQSFVHAALVAAQHHPEVSPVRIQAAGSRAQRAFLRRYQHAKGLDFTGPDQRLLRIFQLRQVCREFIYAATHLPRWSYVPLRALPMLLAEETT